MFSSVADFVGKASEEKFSVLEYARFLSEAESWAISQIIQAALTERTEQCAKIVEQYWHHGPALSLLKDEVVHKVTDRLALQIRALNQPENKS